MPIKINVSEKIMDITGLKGAAKTVRCLSIDAIEKAGSGHPGLPLGCAELGSYLFGEVLKHNPEKLNWLNRDRFVLSAGHGSMLLYSLMLLAGYGLNIDDIKQFRQLKSKTPGHPEYGWTDGVETSTGPLGQGVGNAVGMALAGKINADKFNKKDLTIFDNRVFVLAGDGDLMEGVSYEACSLAGHLKLNNLIMIYDSNNITIEGCTDITFTEDVKLRFESMNWYAVKINGHDFNDIKRGFDEAEKARISQNKPVIIIADTTIGKGAPNKQGTSSCHGAPLGEEECRGCKEELGVKEEFYVDPDAVEYFKNKQKIWNDEYASWNDIYLKWCEKYPKLKKQLDDNYNRKISNKCFENFPEYELGDMQATRNVCNKVLNAAVKDLDYVISGSADLGCSTKTYIKGGDFITPDDYNKHNIQYGVREHAMGAIANGLYLYGGILPIVGTFLSFAPYMKPAIRMASMMRIPIIYMYSHDSFFVGEDGPTHQPVEHISLLRVIPNINVIRPADPYEMRVAWEIALKSETIPNIIITTRQKVPVLKHNELEDYNNAKYGGYILKRESGKKIDLILMASGSEVSISLEAAEKLESEGFSVRVVSMFCTNIFDRQSDEYKNKVLPLTCTNRIAVEAGISALWYKYVGLNGKTIGIDRMGISGKANDVRDFFNFNTGSIYKAAKELINS